MTAIKAHQEPCLSWRFQDVRESESHNTTPPSQPDFPQCPLSSSLTIKSLHPKYRRLQPQPTGTHPIESRGEKRNDQEKRREMKKDEHTNHPPCSAAAEGDTRHLSRPQR
ncbi:hypothetical protein CMEL01_10561 [Colletotrichum melonis]|uniref:Uncharacterized protein n=1 Tax=Colletotrichum melonis TaxID=1209925 RepID=A0AAI9XG82_9PEZI|nr:hypothetical protein CMEL01_10561 [Colletotrichum melonis]